MSTLVTTWTTMPIDVNPGAFPASLFANVHNSVFAQAQNGLRYAVLS